VAKGKKTGGRVAGTPNKISREIRELAQALFDDAYWARKRMEIHGGRCHPSIEAKLLSYAYGEPKQQVELQGDVNVQTIVKHIYQGMDERAH
jgi:hypothetical protein